MAERTLEDDIATRLRRIEGQARGILKMLEEGRECEDMLTQTMAIRSAVDQVGARIMEYHLDRCLLEGFDCDEERMTSLRGALKLWTRFGQPAPAMAIPYE
jgi:DNA-binding FrmR family transcriptional regulator